MLSRIAEALFWIGRYVERADDTARILDVHLQVLLEDSWIDEDLACRSLLSVMGVGAPEGPVGRGRVVELLVDDGANPSSIVGALGAARHNARGARQVVSSEMWHALNTTSTELLVVRRDSVSVHELLVWVRERAAMVAGVADATMSHDDCWHFLVLGRSLERADMTARLVATRSIAGGPSWTHLMRSCGAYQTFLRTYHGAGSEENAAEFLLLDRFPPVGLRSSGDGGVRAAAPQPGAGAQRRVRGGATGDRAGAHGSGVPRRRRAARRPAGGDGADPTGLLGHERRSAAPLLPAEYGWCLGGGGCLVTATVALPTGRPQRLGIVHTTGFHYAGRVLASYNEARMTPLTTPQQTTLDHRIEVMPTASTFRYEDYWGTPVAAFDVRVPHDRLTVTARSVVETFLADRSQAPGDSWADLATDGCRDHFSELLVTTPRTEPVDEAMALARDVVSGLTPAEAGRAVAEWLPGVMDYVPGATGVHTSAAQAWNVRKGVCQDFAHVAVGILRNLGMPARYVSGYLRPRSDAEVGETLRGESHAWVESWSGSWQAWDPTNGLPAGLDHVLVARGRDYDDVPPLKGIYSGAGSGELFVTVEFTRLA